MRKIVLHDMGDTQREGNKPKKCTVVGRDEDIDACCEAVENLASHLCS